MFADDFIQVLKRASDTGVQKVMKVVKHINESKLALSKERDISLLQQNRMLIINVSVSQSINKTSLKRKKLFFFLHHAPGSKIIPLKLRTTCIN